VGMSSKNLLKLKEIGEKMVESSEGNLILTARVCRLSPQSSVGQSVPHPCLQEVTHGAAQSHGPMECLSRKAMLPLPGNTRMKTPGGPVASISGVITNVLPAPSTEFVFSTCALCLGDNHQVCLSSISRLKLRNSSFYPPLFYKSPKFETCYPDCGPLL
jgi:hypothetical protein